MHANCKLGKIVSGWQLQVHCSRTLAAAPEAGIFADPECVAAAVAAVDRAGRCPVAAGPCQHDDHCWDQSATQMISRDVNTHSR